MYHIGVYSFFKLIHTFSVQQKRDEIEPRSRQTLKRDTPTFMQMVQLKKDCIWNIHWIYRNCLGQFCEIPWKIYFDNAGNNMTLTLYNVTLTAQKPCEHNNNCDCSKTYGLNEVYIFFNKISLFNRKSINLIYC